MKKVRIKTKRMAPDQENKEIQNLQFLGLTLNHAKVYAALVKSGNVTAKNLSSNSGLATCNIYRVIPELQKLGLLEVTVTAPKLFKATPPEDAMKILLKQKEEDFKMMQVKAKEFLAETEMEKSPKHADIAEVVLVPCGMRTTQFEKSRLSNTEEQLGAIHTDAVFHRFIDDAGNDLEKLLRRNVKMRFLLENTKAIEKPTKKLAKMLSNPNFNVRFAKTQIKTCVFVFDNIGAFISTSFDPLHTPSYWSTNPCVIAVVRGYFENEWQEALEKTN